MARSPKRPPSQPKQPQFTPSVQMAWPTTPFPFGVQMLQVQPPITEGRKITKEDLKDSEVILDDGSTIIIKLSIKDVKKIIGQTSPTGDPIYVFQLTWTFQTKTLSKQRITGARKSTSKTS